jgi:propionyl-CoA carboxylase alpha chain
MIKASAGGGGKGMRIAHSAAQEEEGFRLARSEAKASFGDDRVFIEKFIVEPRHIEIQVLGDKHGNVIHLGERECSIQRRNQKVIEEAPSPLLDAETRARMGAQAVALAKAVNYDSAGTVEFVAGQDKSFYFLEMNTRLQVEHPVTELVTGIDLVEQMFRVAAGEKLALKQSDIKLKGWAVEARVYAEDPLRNFLPSIGRLTLYRPPAERAEKGITVRNDTGVFEGGEISIHYDPMIAKLCTHALTRASAITAMSDALDSFAIEGIRHNIPFLAALMQHPRWREGRLSTAFIANEYPDGFAMKVPENAIADRLAAVATMIDHVQNQRKRRISGQMGGRPVTFDRARVAVVGRLSFDVEVDEARGELQVTFLNEAGSAGRIVTLTSDWKPGQPVWSGLINGEAAAMLVRPIPNGVVLSHRGSAAEIRVYTGREAELARLMPIKTKMALSTALLCPMPGLVRTIEVVEGQEVKAGEALCVVEAMKMENVLRAERDTKVKKIRVKPGDTLSVDAIIMDFA